jgi:hypothetical protein
MNEEILKELKTYGITSRTLAAYLSKLGTALEEAYNAGENDKDYVAMVKIGEAKVYFDAVRSIWDELSAEK